MPCNEKCPVFLNKHTVGQISGAQGHQAKGTEKRKAFANACCRQLLKDSVQHNTKICHQYVHVGFHYYAYFNLTERSPTFPHKN